MDPATRIENELLSALTRHDACAGPPLLGLAMHHAVFPGGARIRPRLCVAVAQACGGEPLAVALAAATAIELQHCASLVHDDLPCFDDADVRRGRPSVHKAFGEQLAVLAGDGLIMLAFQSLARVGVLAGERLAPLLEIICGAVGPHCGIVAGQAWECEPRVDLERYHAAKTGALFAAATMAGAVAAGREPQPWQLPGARLGEAYQVADDIRDVVSEAAELGKPAGKDASLGRPNAVQRYGLAGAVERLEQLMAEAIAGIPPCAGAAGLRSLFAGEAQRLLPKKLAQRRAA